MCGLPSSDWNARLSTVNGDQLRIGVATPTLDYGFAVHGFMSRFVGYIRQIRLTHLNACKWSVVENRICDLIRVR